MNPDSYEALSPSQRGRTKKRRTKSPRIPTRARQGEHGCKTEVESTEHSGRRQKAYPKSNRNVIQGDQREGTKAPEDEGMREPGQRPLANHLGLAKDFGEKLPGPLPDGRKMEAGILFRLENEVNNPAEPPPEQHARSDDQNG